MQECLLNPHQWHEITYPRLRLNDHTLDDKLPISLSKPKDARLRPPPTTNIGVLDALPLEILEMILSQLDMRTLTDFRRVNRRATELVESLRYYRAISTNAQNALHGVLSIGTARWITCKSLYKKLCTPECEQCGDFGGYLYLLTCKRVCFLCLSEDRLYLPLLPRHASRRFGLKHQILETLPRMRVIPGIYSPNEKKAAQAVLIDYESALRAGIALHGSLDAMHKYVSDMEALKLQAYHERMVAAQQAGPITRRVRRPQTADPFDGQSGNPLRFVAIIRFPWLIGETQQVEWGFHCVGCEESSLPPLHYRRQFTTATFDSHLRECGNIQDGKHHPG